MYTSGGDNGLDSKRLEMLKQIAQALAAQFGPGCEVVIHDLAAKDPEKSIVYIVNGHVTGRRVGDGPSTVVMEQLLHANETPVDHLGYLTRTPDGKILKSSTIYIRDTRGRVTAILSINYDISALLMMETAIGGLVHTSEEASHGKEERITVLNVSDLLDDLIEQSVTLVGKPVALMNKDDKVRAIQFLSQHGAFLITKSGDKVAKYFGISKYTLYSYIDLKQEEKRHEQN
jgi:predicted transcriptional regulator YheO